MIITEVAQSKIAELIENPKEVMPHSTFFLRVTAIENDGIKYQTYFDYETREDDLLTNFNGFDLRIDKESDKYLELVTLDFIEDKGFTLDTPN